MPPKVTDTRPASPEAMHTVEEETALAARKIIATYATGMLDGVTLMCMLGVEPDGLQYKKFTEDYADQLPKKKSAKKAAKKSTKKSSAKKSTKQSTAKKTTKKSTAKKATKKSTAKKTTKKSTAKKTAKKS